MTRLCRTSGWLAAFVIVGVVLLSSACATSSGNDVPQMKAKAEEIYILRSIREQHEALDGLDRHDSPLAGAEMTAANGAFIGRSAIRAARFACSISQSLGSLKVTVIRYQ